MSIRRPLARRLVIGVTGALIVAIVATATIAAWLLRDREFDNWERQLSLLTLALAEHTSQSMSSAEIAMLSIAEQIDALGIRDVEDLHVRAGTEGVHRMLKERIVGLHQVDVATIVDANGDVVNFSRSFPPPRINLADRDYFRMRRDFPEIGTFVSLPVRNKGTGTWLFYLSVRLNDVRGRFVGLAIVGISVDQLSDFYRKLCAKLGDGATITLLRSDFTNLTRWPLKEETIGKQNLIGSSHFVVAELQKSDDVVRMDGPRFSEAGRIVPRLGAVRVLERYPLIVNLSIPEDLILTHWRRTTVSIGTVAGGSLLALGLAVMVLLRILRQREESTALLDNLTDRVPGVLFQLRIYPDGQANFPYVNQPFLDQYGLKREQLPVEAERIFAYQHPEDSSGIRRSIAEATRTLQPWHHEYRLILPGRGIVWRRGDAVGQKLADGSVLWHGYIADITEQKLAEEQTAELNRDFISFLENTSDFIYFKDADSRIRFCSQTMAHITGHASWRDMIGRHDSEIFPEDTARIYSAEELPIFRDARPLLNKVDPYYDAAGKAGWVSTSKWPLLDAHGKVIGLFGISRDVTSQVENERRLELAASVFTYSREGIMITDADGTIVEVNDAFTRITGYAGEESVGRNPRILSSGRHERDYYEAMWKSLREKGHWYGEIWNRRKNGEVYAEMQTVSAVRDETGAIRNYVSLFSDITAHKMHQKQLERIAHYDALTTLPNRVLLADRLHQAMVQAQRRGLGFAVVYLDLDGFKEVNDRHGHEVGDQLLMAVAARMKAALREGDTLARLGGDEFVAVLLDLADAQASVAMLTRLLNAAAEPVHVGNVSVRVSASLGVTFYPQGEDVDADQLLRQADQAMYQAKLLGKNRYHLFDWAQDRSVRGLHESLDGIRRALERGEFVLHYQPKVNMRSGELVGAEALIRWQHPEKNELLPPLAFLPVIEDHPLAVGVGEWVIETALTQIEDWRQIGLNVPISVNVGAYQLQQPDFARRLGELVAAHPAVRAGDLELEVLETSALEDLTQTSKVIEACGELGVTFALDDFGTGYSSLTYLKRLAVNRLKIDQSFVRDMLFDPDDLAILEGVLGLATAFRRDVIAEGVETPAHCKMLLQLGCDYAQGYGIARPMPAEAFAAWSHSWQPDPHWAGQRRVHRDELPLVVAGVEHRAWRMALTGYLNGEADAPPLLGAFKCRFGSWLDTAGREHYGRSPVFNVVEALHTQIHDAAALLCARYQAGDVGEIRIDDLGILCDALTEKLDEMLERPEG